MAPNGRKIAVTLTSQTTLLTQTRVVPAAEIQPGPEYTLHYLSPNGVYALHLAPGETAPLIIDRTTVVSLGHIELCVADMAQLIPQEHPYVLRFTGQQKAAKPAYNMLTLVPLRMSCWRLKNSGPPPTFGI